VLYRVGRHPGYLDDYAFLSMAFWELYRVDGAADWKAKAHAIDGALLNHFLAEGELSFGGADRERLAVDVFLDRELPSPGGIVLRLLAHQQGRAPVIDAERALRQEALSQVIKQPSDSLSVISALAEPVPAASAIIALGHGRAALTSKSANRLHLTLDLDPGWHVNASEIADQRLVPTRVSSDDVLLSATYPEGRLLKTEFADQPLLVYEDSVEIAIDNWDPAERSHALVELQLQACSESICLLPEKILLRPSG
jgi:hypothetical protein